MELRSEIVGWANYMLRNKTDRGRWQMFYSEGPARMSSIGTKPGTFPVTCDCSAFVTLCYYWAGAPDPNGLNFDHEGYTGTLLSHDQHVALFAQNNKHKRVTQVRAGDLVVYGPGTGTHVALIVKVRHRDILTISMGEQGDPNYVWVNAPRELDRQGFAVDGREPQTFLRCKTRRPWRVVPSYYRIPPKPTLRSLNAAARGTSSGPLN